MEYKEALKRGLYDFEIARNWYRSVTSPDNGGPGLHGDLVFTWIRNNALLIAPFTPHFSEHVWKNILGETTSVQKASFPQPSQSVDPIKLQEIEYMRGVVDSMRSAEAVLSKRKGKAAKTGPTFDPSKPKSARVYVATEFPEWQNKGVELVRSAWNEQEGTIDDAKLRQALDAAGLSKDKKAMPFCQSFKVSTSGMISRITLMYLATSFKSRSFRVLSIPSFLRIGGSATLGSIHQVILEVCRV